MPPIIRIDLTDLDDDFVQSEDTLTEIYAKKGNDSVRGGIRSDTIYGEEGDDFLNGFFGEDILDGGAGNDILDGGSADDVLSGGTGNDVLDGGNGLDSMNGGAGNDIYFIDDAFEVIFEDPGQGIDTVYTFSGAFLSANVENLFALGARAVSLDGNGLANQIVGNDSPNVIDGKGGSDRMEGKRGNDIYWVDSAGDVIVELAGQGSDTVISAINYTLGANLENLELDAAALKGTGNALANMIEGNDAANIIDGGAGADIMDGGKGNDTYFVDNLGDRVAESALGGTDTVNSSVNYTAIGEVENIALTGNAAINGTGNGLVNKITGNAAANVLDGEGGVDTLAGGLGNDTYHVDVEGDVVVESGAGVDTVRSTASFYTLAANVENLVVLSADGSGTGNILNNKLTGAAGKQYLNGGLGADDMRGGLGNDTYFVDNVGDAVVELAGQGLDEVQSTITYTLAATLEYLSLIGTAAINGTGNGFANLMAGNDAANVLNGGLGADQMFGRGGSDTYVVDNLGDQVFESSNQGTDTVNSSVNFVLPDGVENLNLTGAALKGTGNLQGNKILGNVLANTLDGGGANDVLTGGLGNDTYVVDNIADKVIELAGQGADTVNSSAADYTLAANVENLFLLVGASSGTGNALANRITGNAAANFIDGGQGADDMRGGGESDFYVVDNLGDKVTEAASQGDDTVVSLITYTLGANIENLQLAGLLAINGTGNGFNNKIIGNLAANILNGGVGQDTMTGAAGNDAYILDNSGDVVVEIAGQGIDTVNSSVSAQLSAHVENLNLTGTGATSGIGNDLANKIVGNAAGNFIAGAQGADTLTGGLGADFFAFVSLDAVDTITDFSAAADTILLYNSAFANLLPVGSPVTLVANATPSAGGPGPTLLYDTDNGRLSIDFDGNGGSPALLFAILSSKPLITASDFEVR
jgi:trimeric autotransporter adhesin